MGRGAGMKDTSTNIKARNEFVVNLVPQRLAQAMNETSVEFDYGIDELAQVGLTTVPGHLVGVPRIAESPVALECVPMHFLELGAGRVIVAARVLSVYVDDNAVLDASKCHIDTPVLDLIGRMHGRGEYAYTRELFTMLRPSGKPGSQGR
jgi:flavin reductase (DIM6/NTAB) family NADH-FMN oxidoreductase RutF